MTIETPFKKINLLGLDQEALVSFFEHIGEKPFRAVQVLKWIHQEGVIDFSQMLNLSKVLREKLSELCEVKFLEVAKLQISKDGTRKWLFQLPEGGAIETVLIPEPGRATLCISSQVGCSLNCRFCHTAQQGFQRQLSTAEIIGQLWQVWHSLKAEGIVVKDGRPVTNVVMMGMGEPLLNFDNVVPALNLMRNDLAYGLSKYRVTVSTSGVVPYIDKLAQVSDVALALSLHAPNDKIRTEIVPINKKYPLKILLDSVKRYIGENSRRKITMEYVMLKGVNDQPEHARELVTLLRGVPCKVNLIPFNPFKGTSYECSDLNTIAEFSSILQKGRLVTTVRKTRGQDIDAACGQLAGKVKDKTQRSAKIAAKLITQVVPA